MIIALDGPAGAGKGTIGRRLAAHFQLAYLDTGAIYRAVARDALNAAIALSDADAAAEIAQALDLTTLDDPALHTADMGAAASTIAAHPPVRAALLQLQRDFAASPPSPASNGAPEKVLGALLDGRDIGTIVCPDADAKIYLTASPHARAARRAAQLRDAGEAVDEAELARAIAERDARDANRPVAPMKPASDAALLDTTLLSIDAAFEAARQLVDDAIARRRDASS